MQIDQAYDARDIENSTSTSIAISGASFGHKTSHRQIANLDRRLHLTFVVFFVATEGRLFYQALSRCVGTEEQKLNKHFFPLY